MSSLRRSLLRLVNACCPWRAEPDLDRELASHVRLLEDDFQRRGLSKEEAKLAAKRAFGGMAQAKDLHRDARSFVWLNDARRDLRYAIRTLCRAPGFAAVAILALALGIGANTAIFSAIDAILIRPLDRHAPAQLKRFSDDLADRLRDITDVVAAGYSRLLPMVQPGLLPARWSSTMTSTVALLCVLCFLRVLGAR